MVYVKWCLLIIPSFVMAIVGRILAPILPLFCDDDGWLPQWLSWFQTPDNSCDGDEGHWRRWPKTGLFWTYIRRVAWLLRNVAYGFDDTVCGVKALPTDKLETFGDPIASDTNGVSGYCDRYLYRDGKLIAFHYYYIKHYKIGSYPVCLRVSLGWKLWNPNTMNKQFTCYFNPIK